MNKWILFISRRSDQEDQRGSFVHQGSISGGETEWKCMPGMQGPCEDEDDVYLLIAERITKNDYCKDDCYCRR